MRGGLLRGPVLQLQIPGVCVRACVCVCVCVCVWMFSECGVLSFVLRFSVIFSAAEIPRGQNQGQNHWAEDLWCFTSQFWDVMGFSPLILEVQDTAGYTSHERRGGTQFKREKESGLCCCWKVHIPDKTFHFPSQKLSFVTGRPPLL